eukprot:364556-Chlamydomonas_euryale.AAC.20
MAFLPAWLRWLHQVRKAARQAPPGWQKNDSTGVPLLHEHAEQLALVRGCCHQTVPSRFTTPFTRTNHILYSIPFWHVPHGPCGPATAPPCWETGIPWKLQPSLSFSAGGLGQWVRMQGLLARRRCESTHAQTNETDGGAGKQTPLLEGRGQGGQLPSNSPLSCDVSAPDEPKRWRRRVAEPADTYAAEAAYMGLLCARRVRTCGREYAPDGDAR